MDIPNTDADLSLARLKADSRAFNICASRFRSSYLVKRLAHDGGNHAVAALKRQGCACEWD